MDQLVAIICRRLDRLSFSFFSLYLTWHSLPDMAAYGRFFTDSAAKQRVVKEVQFGVLSPDEIVRIFISCEGES